MVVPIVEEVLVDFEVSNVDNLFACPRASDLVQSHKMKDSHIRSSQQEHRAVSDWHFRNSIV